MDKKKDDNRGSMEPVARISAVRMEVAAELDRNLSLDDGANRASKMRTKRHVILALSVRCAVLILGARPDASPGCYVPMLLACVAGLVTEASISSSCANPRLIGAHGLLMARDSGMGRVAACLDLVGWGGGGDYRWPFAMAT